MRLFPCTMKNPDGTLRQPVKVDSTPNGTILYGWGPDGGEVIAETPHPIERRLQVDHYRLQLADGTTVDLVKICSCSGFGQHPLRGWLPEGAPRAARVYSDVFTGTP